MDLAEGRIGCPGCGEALRRWGWARVRQIRAGLGETAGSARHRPRRGRCAGCGATHVLLAVSLAARRADAAVVIAAAVEAKVAGGQGHRPIAAALGRPASTVRDWLRAFMASAERIGHAFAALVLRDAPDAAALWPSPTSSAPARALSVLSAYGAAVAGRFGVVTVGWVRAGITATAGRLFSAPWWSQIDQHQSALTSARVGGPGSR